MNNNDVRVGVDIGGTFTDFALKKGEDLFTLKVLTTPDAPEEAIMTGIARILQDAACKAEDIQSIVHGTTLATNAIIEKKGARIALITTEGFRDVLEMGTESRFDQYDLNLVKPQPLVPRDRRYTIRERLSADGSVLLPLDLNGLDSLVEQLKIEDIQSVAICFLHSYVNADHEEKVAQTLRERLPGLYISLSSQVAPEIREYERFSTTVANAYVQPLIDSYLERLADKLQAENVNCPVFMFLSNGGLAEMGIVRQFPIRLVESGPAGGAVFASHVAQCHQEEKIVSFDMGGTTAKLCLIDNAEPKKANVFEMARVHRFKEGSGLPARIPVIEMVEIGAGGGSIARVDELSRITVGPDSAGSEPGPACYGRGGTSATVTDSDLVLGRLEAEGFADGSMDLVKDAAEQALATNIGEVLQMNSAVAAFGVLELVEEDMANAAREHATENGLTLNDRTMVAFGGAAPLHALPLAGKLGIERLIVPASASVGSAVGFLLAPVSYELSRTCNVRLSHFRVKEVNQLFAEISAQAHEVVGSGAPNEPRHEKRQALMRYVGQGYNITVDIPTGPLTTDDENLLREAFNNTYRGLYYKLHEGVDIQIVGVNISVSTKAESVKTLNECNTPDFKAAQFDHKTQLFDLDSAAYRQTPVFLREVFSRNEKIEGAALIRDKGTTIVVPSGWLARVADNLDLVIEKVKA